MWLHRSQMLARANYHCGCRNFSGFDQSIPQKHIRFVSAFTHFEIVGLVEKERIDIIDIDEIYDVDGLGCFNIDSGKILFLQGNKFTLLIFVTFNDL